MQTPMRLNAPAKINRFLHITARRHDGYHELETLFQFLDYGDILTFTKENNYCGAITRIDKHDFTLPKRDLIYQAAEALKQYSSKALPDISITLEKNIPPGSGLGGGSSNAATTLLALNQIWELRLNRQELLDIAVTLGADVPIFIMGKACLAYGIGEHLIPWKAQQTPILLCLPNTHAATASVFSKLCPPFRQAAQDIKDVADSNKNDLENAACELYPQIQKALSILRKFGDARMSGTGAAVFLSCTSENASKLLSQELQQQYPEFTWIASKTMNQSTNPLCF